MRLRLVVNGENHEIDDVWEGESLLYVLRERLGLPGSKNACEQGECGSCSVHMDGILVCACLVLAGQARGREVLTVEGIAEGNELHPVQEAFVEAGAVRGRLFDRVRKELGEGFDYLSVENGDIMSEGEVVLPLAEVLDEEIEETVEYRHRPTYPPDENGQGDIHVQFAFAAHRAVVEVDVELGLVRVVELATAQDVGKAMNPQALEGQIEGGVAQGLGLALLEEIQIKNGRIQNASFTDYLLPTILDMPSVRMDILELADPEAPYGLKGVGEPPTISSTPAIVAALRDAIGYALPRVPVKPEQIADIAMKPLDEPPQSGSAGYAEVCRLDERREQ